MDGASLTNTLLKSHLYLFLIAVFSEAYFYIQKEREKPCQSWTVWSVFVGGVFQHAPLAPLRIRALTPEQL
jgi:hypothetical protein